MQWNAEFLRNLWNSGNFLWILDFLILLSREAIDSFLTWSSFSFWNWHYSSIFWTSLCPQWDHSVPATMWRAWGQKNGKHLILNWAHVSRSSSLLPGGWSQQHSCKLQSLKCSAQFWDYDTEQPVTAPISVYFDLLRHIFFPYYNQ